MLRTEYFQVNVLSDLLRSQRPDVMILFSACGSVVYNEASIKEVTPVKSELTDFLLMDVIDWRPIVACARTKAKEYFTNKYCIGSKVIGDVIVSN